MSGIPLQQNIIYGPVFSRRLGRSLGINLLSRNYKVCSFNCVYCEYGETKGPTMKPMKEDLPSADEVLLVVEKALKKPRTIETITFSGNGEPTLHPDFFEIVRGVRATVDRIQPGVKLALLSNSSTIMNPQVIAALDLIDLPWMKLDAGDELTFQSINRPVEGIHLQDILNGLSAVKRKLIQSVLIEGEVVNVQSDFYENWAKTLADLHPEIVQIYSTDRPTAISGVRCIPPRKLQQIQADLQSRFHLNVESFWREP